MNPTPIAPSSQLNSSSELARCLGLFALVGAILVSATLAMSLNCQAQEAKKNAVGDDKFEDLFDGKSLNGWSGDSKFWRVEGGAIVGESTPEKVVKQNTFLICQGKPVGDFELRVKFRITGPQANSGIQFRSKDRGDYSVGGYQADIDATGQYMGILYEERGRGILAKRGQRVTRSKDGKSTVHGQTVDDDTFASNVKAGQWNEYVIQVEGYHVVQKINGLTTVDFTDQQKDKAATAGILAFQMHVGPPMKIEFKDVRLRRIK